MMEEATTQTTTLQLLDLPDDLLLYIYSFLAKSLDFEKRSVYRKTSRHFARVLDKLLPPCDNVELKLLLKGNDQQNIIIYEHRNNNNTKITMKLYCNSMHDGSMMPMSNSYHSVLSWLRPSFLKIQWDSGTNDTEDNVPPVVAVDFLKVVLKDVAISLQELALYMGLPSIDSRLYEAFAPLKQSLKSLSIHSLTPPLGHTPSFIVTSMQALEKLEFRFKEPMGWVPLEYNDGIPICALDSLKQLQQLSIRRNSDTTDLFSTSQVFTKGLLIGCCEVRHLQVLHNDFVLNDGWALGFALHHLKQLQELGQLQSPKQELWQELHGGGGHEQLKKLYIRYSYLEGITAQDLEAMVTSIVQDFPALQELDLSLEHFIDTDDANNGMTAGQIARVLLGLNRHSNLTTIACCAEKHESGNAIRSALKEAFGQGMEIRKSSYNSM